MNRIRESPVVTVVRPDESQFELICDEFERFDHRQISFADHTTGTLAGEFDAEHVFAFDGDFRTSGVSLVPDDISLPEE